MKIHFQFNFLFLLVFVLFAIFLLWLTRRRKNDMRNEIEKVFNINKMITANIHNDHMLLCDILANCDHFHSKKNIITLKIIWIWSIFSSFFFLHLIDKCINRFPQCEYYKYESTILATSRPVHLIFGSNTKYFLEIIKKKNYTLWIENSKKAEKRI